MDATLERQVSSRPASAWRTRAHEPTAGGQLIARRESALGRDGEAPRGSSGERFTDPTISELVVTSDGFVLARAAEPSRAREALARHLRGRALPTDRRALERVGMFLVRRGFDPDTVRTTLRSAADATDELSEKDE